MRDENLLAYGKGLASMFRGERNDYSAAAAVNFAETLRLIHDALTK